MDNEKVVVVLLLVTIILSVFSVILTVSFSNGGAIGQKRTVVDNPNTDGSVNFQIVNPPADNAAGGGQ